LSNDNNQTTDKGAVRITSLNNNNSNITAININMSSLLPTLTG